MLCLRVKIHQHYIYTHGRQYQSLFSWYAWFWNTCSRGSRKIGTPDILFVPIGGGDLLDAAQAHKLALSLETKLLFQWNTVMICKRCIKTFLKRSRTRRCFSD